MTYLGVFPLTLQSWWNPRTKLRGKVSVAICQAIPSALTEEHSMEKPFLWMKSEISIKVGPQSGNIRLVQRRLFGVLWFDCEVCPIGSSVWTLGLQPVRLFGKVIEPFWRKWVNGGSPWGFLGRHHFLFSLCFSAMDAMRPATSCLPVPVAM